MHIRVTVQTVFLFAADTGDSAFESMTIPADFNRMILANEPHCLSDWFVSLFINREFAAKSKIKDSNPMQVFMVETSTGVSIRCFINNSVWTVTHTDRPIRTARILIINTNQPTSVFYY